MQFPLIQNLFADRMGGINYGKNNEPPSKLERSKRTREQVVIQNPYKALMDFSMREPTFKADQATIESFYQEKLGPFNRFNRNSSYPEFTVAVAQFMQRVFKVLLDPTIEVMQAISSKSALSLLLACFINPGDVVLITRPGYPFFDIQVRYFGGIVYHVPFDGSNDYFPDFNSIPNDLLAQAKVLVLPSIPTVAYATLDFFEKIVDWAKAHNVLIIQEASYACFSYKNHKPTSILQIKGAKNIAVEVHSLSMPGCSIAWICSNSLIIQALKEVKDNIDSSQSFSNEKRAAQALTSVDIFERMSLIYSRRMHLLYNALDDLGLDPIRPKAGLLLFCRAPIFGSNGPYSGEFYSAFGFSQWLIRMEHICAFPWDDIKASAGFSVAFDAEINEEEENKFIERMYGRLMNYKFEFRKELLNLDSA